MSNNTSAILEHQIGEAPEVLKAQSESKVRKSKVKVGFPNLPPLCRLLSRPAQHGSSHALQQQLASCNGLCICSRLRSCRLASDQPRPAKRVGNRFSRETACPSGLIWFGACNCLLGERKLCFEEKLRSTFLLKHFPLQIETSSDSIIFV